MSRKFSPGRKRKKGESFNPNSAYIRIAVDEYFKAGGKVTQQYTDSNSPIGPDATSYADSFLLRG